MYRLASDRLLVATQWWMWIAGRAIPWLTLRRSSSSILMLGGEDGQWQWRWNDTGKNAIRERMTAIQAIMASMVYPENP